ncbi:hypothetical protein FN846DRAFT_523549 [Sphaerosporella brunnea]|uniref:DASH complex subunit DAD2 n=1 Tax=Sphaerosporella brunnea TaxID=1250544 RepID=A0A5J5ED19_9PEZI|nr:hypothetical protein FN846DRAFT_523549 [Sphaerosporella brunnea]
MSTTTEDAALTKELESLKVLRATLESVKHLVDNVVEDVQTAGKNHGAIVSLAERWQGVFEEILPAEDVGGAEKGKRKGRFGRS